MRQGIGERVGARRGPEWHGKTTVCRKQGGLIAAGDWGAGRRAERADCFGESHGLARGNRAQGSGSRVNAVSAVSMNIGSAAARCSLDPWLLKIATGQHPKAYLVPRSPAEWTTTSKNCSVRLLGCLDGCKLWRLSCRWRSKYFAAVLLTSTYSTGPPVTRPPDRLASKATHKQQTHSGTQWLFLIWGFL